MSTTTSAIDARGYLSGWLQGLQGMYTADINAIPDDKWKDTFGGCTRSACELTADAVAFTDWVARAINGDVDPNYNPDTMKVFVDRCSTKEGAVAGLQQHCTALFNAITTASDDDLQRTITAPWGMDTPAFMLAHIAVSHLWYHDGQLNYIQSLLGDGQVHWMH